MTIAPALTFINPMWFGILFAIIGALLIEKLRTSYSNYQEIAIPIIMSAGIALSAILFRLQMVLIKKLLDYYLDQSVL